MRTPGRRGLLVAATGAFTGSVLGVAVLWAVVTGARVGFVLNEGLARWQPGTGQCASRLTPALPA